jgi:poly-gamma-glutamate capsule biosynthesis protein CapA/YwtB (metallophosphatase superfamily)
LIVIPPLAAADPAKDPEARERVSILFAGDTYFGEHHFFAAKNADRLNLLAEKGYGFPLEHLLPLLQVSDEAILNLETPVLSDLAVAGGKPAFGYPVHSGSAGPTLRVLRDSGVTAVSLANNHTMDFGTAGLHQTLAALAAAGIEHFGAGQSSREASRPLHRKLRVGRWQVDVFVLGAYAYRKAYEADFGFYATSATPGVWMLDEGAISQQIREIRAGYPNALVIGFPHWGWNYAWKDETQQRLAQVMIEAGADLVVGHGAHRLQEIERYEGRWLVYGLGNFLFNTRGRYEAMNSPPYSLVARLLLEQAANGVSVTLRLYPIVSDNRLVNFQPRPVTQEEFDTVRALLDPSLHVAADGLGPFFELAVGTYRGSPSQAPVSR